MYQHSTTRIRRAHQRPALVGWLLLLLTMLTVSSGQAMTFVPGDCGVTVTTSVYTQGSGHLTPTLYCFAYSWTYNTTDINGKYQTYRVSTDQPTIVIPTKGLNITTITVMAYGTRYSNGKWNYDYDTSDRATQSVTPNGTQQISVTSLSPTSDPNERALPSSLTKGSHNDNLFYADVNGWLKIAQYYDNIWHHWYLTQTWNIEEALLVNGSVAVNSQDQVFYTDRNHKLRSYQWTPTNGWQSSLLTRVAGTSEDVADGPNAISIGKDNTVFYAGADGWIHTYSRNPSTQQWDHQILTTTFNANEQAYFNGRSRLPVVVGTVGASPSTDQVFYKGNDNLLHSYYKDNTGWHHMWFVKDWNEEWETTVSVDGQIVVGKNGKSVYFVGSNKYSAGSWIRAFFYYDDTWLNKMEVSAYSYSHWASGSTTPSEGNLAIGANDQLFFSGNLLPSSQSQFPTSRLQTYYQLNASSNPGTPNHYERGGIWQRAFLDSNDPHTWGMAPLTPSIPASAQIYPATLTRTQQIYASHIVPTTDGRVYYVGQDQFIRQYYRDNCIATTGVLSRSQPLVRKPGTAGRPPTVNGSLAAGSLQVYPNPANQAATVEFLAEKETTATVEVFSAIGKLEYRSQVSVVAGKNSLGLTTESLATGLHTVSIREVGKQALHVKLAIVK